jgi:3-(3-hydroxy-phenyl)propionate hydroxylase
MSRQNDVQVAVIGFGPSGAVAASLLGQAGITTLAIDKDVEIFPKPRALAVDHEIMRLFDNLGVAEQVLPFTAPFTASEHFGADGQLIRRIDMVPPPYPMGYVPSMVFGQPPVEAVLRAHAATWPGVEIALGTALERLEQDDDGVTLTLRTPDGGQRIVRAGHVIGCDGASSLVRQSLGIALEDLVFDEPWLVIDVMLNPGAEAKLPQNSAQFCDPARPTSYLIGPGLHRRWEIMLLPGEDRFAMENPDAVWRLLSPWLTPVDGTLWRASSYRFHALVAQQWRRGRVFLAGDSAHQQPPFIGQGMCQGLRDVSNLVWKLAATLRGEAGDGLLDTYGDERGAHVRELTGRIKAIGHVICERDPAAARARDIRILAEGGGTARTITRQDIVPKLSCGLLSAQPDQPGRGSLFPQPLVRHAGGIALLDRVCGAGFRLVMDAGALGTDAAGLSAQARAAGVTPILIGPGHIEECDGVVAGWFARHAGSAALVRPDHYVFGTAGDAAGAALMLSELSACRPALS